VLVQPPYEDSHADRPSGTTGHQHGLDKQPKGCLELNDGGRECFDAVDDVVDLVLGHGWKSGDRGCRRGRWYLRSSLGRMKLGDFSLHGGADSLFKGERIGFNPSSLGLYPWQL